MNWSDLVLEFDARANRLSVEATQLRPQLREFAYGGSTVFIAGYPIWNGKADDRALAKALSDAPSVDNIARDIDGTFLIVVGKPSENAVRVISDRFASFGFYYGHGGPGQLTGGMSLSSLVKRLGGLQLDEVALAEFLHFRRIFGEKTYDRRCSFLASASVLEQRADGWSVRKYWQPDYGARRLDLDAGVDAIAGGLQRAMRGQMADASPDRRYALFMSGGLDSRALLIAADQKPLCVTTCVLYNNEAQVAEEVASAAGAPFVFIPQPSGGYDRHIAEAVYYGGGQHILTEAHFIDYESLLRPRAECFFLGLGLDVFFGGLYLPKRPARWLGRDALHFKMKPIADDPREDFINGVKYRLKTSDPWQIVKPDARGRLQEALRGSIGDIVERGKALGAEKYDLWEYLHLHNFGRHYSFLMIGSVRHWAECKVPALCNELFDIAFALPAELKVNSQAYLGALNRISSRAMKIRNANTNIAAGTPFWLQSATRAGRIVANRLGADLRVSPTTAERSWPAPRAILQDNARLSELVRALAKSEQLASLGVIDLDAVQKRIDDHFAGRSDESILLLLLATVDEFVRQVH